MRPILFGLLWCLVLLSSCSRENLTSAKQNPQATHDETATLKSQCDNEADLVCGMPLSSGVGDTAHYTGKVFGFCSKGCKDKFSKNPTKYLAAK